MTLLTEAGVIWRRHHGALVPLQMPHTVSECLDEARLGTVLVRSRAFFARWEDAFDELDSGEWWHVIKDEMVELSDLSTNTRSKVRRGLKRFEVAPETLESILAEGYEVYCAAFVRYETFERRSSKDDFQNYLNLLPDETEFWGVRDRDSAALVAFSENLVRDDACFYNTVWLDPKGLKAYASYALFHKMNEFYLNERGCRYVSDGARSISHQTNIHNFLIQKFGFRRAYARLRVFYAPGVGLAVKILYPLRGWFSRGSSRVSQKLDVLLAQERIRRSFSAKATNE